VHYCNIRSYSEAFLNFILRKCLEDGHIRKDRDFLFCRPVICEGQQEVHHLGELSCASVD
jgi:hypothetical protein